MANSVSTPCLIKRGVGTTTRQHREEECWIRHGKPGDVTQVFSAFKMHDIDDVTGKWWRSRKKLYFSEQNANHGHVSLMANLNGQALFSDLPWLHDTQDSDCLVGISRINDVGLPRTILWSRISRPLFGTKNTSVVPSHGLLWDKG